MSSVSISIVRSRSIGKSVLVPARLMIAKRPVVDNGALELMSSSAHTHDHSQRVIILIRKSMLLTILPT